MATRTNGAAQTRLGMGALLLLASIIVGCAASTTPTTSPAAPNPTLAAVARLRAQMNDIDPAISVQVGDLLPNMTLPLALPDGATQDAALREWLAGQYAIVYFYVQDNTPL
jgi:hypothetical protein